MDYVAREAKAGEEAPVAAAYANVVITLHEWGLWSTVVDRCDVHLSGTIIDEEADFFRDDRGDARLIDLSSDISTGRIIRFDVPSSAVDAFKSRFRPAHFDSRDPGEAESLTYLLSVTEDIRICSGDNSCLPSPRGTLHE